MTPAAAVAIATCEEYPELDAEGRLLLAALERRGVPARPQPWTVDPAGGWERFELVVVRSTWDYQDAPERFLAWARALGAPLLNPPAAVAWNADKRYLLELARAGLPTIPARLLAAGEPLDPPPGRFVVKPTVGAGARGAAVFDGRRHDAARRHVGALHAAGRDVLVQPYLDAVDGDEGETAVVFVDGEVTHALRKGPLLALDRPPPAGLFAAERVRPRAPAGDALALARRVHAHAADRFGTPLYARVDMLRDAGGRPLVLELELIEPSLFADRVPAAADALAAAIARRLRVIRGEARRRSGGAPPDRPGAR